MIHILILISINIDNDIVVVYLNLKLTKKEQPRACKTLVVLLRC